MTANALLGRARTAVARLPRPRRETVLWGLVLVNVELLFVASYASVTGRSLLDPFLYYPLVWIDVALWAFVRTDPPSAPPSRRRVATAVGAGYFLLLAVLSSSVAPGARFGGNPATGLELRLFSIPPGWAPTVTYDGALVHLSLVPPYLLGFVALSYLVYAAVLDASGAASLGVLGTFVTCLPCTVPLVAAGVGVLTGASTASLLGTVAPYVYPVGTGLFVATVGLLYVRPGFGLARRIERARSKLSERRSGE